MQRELQLHLTHVGSSALRCWVRRSNAGLARSIPVYCSVNLTYKYLKIYISRRASEIDIRMPYVLMISGAVAVAIGNSEPVRTQPYLEKTKFARVKC